jgi:hypothetical protein
MRTVFLILIASLALHTAGAAERCRLANDSINPERLRTQLLLNQTWVKYPPYADRKAWDQLTGEHKPAIIARGERLLNYEWKVVKATDYLEYERSGDRNIMQTPNNANTNALAELALAELAEGQGRFTDQIINGVFYHTERTSWVLSAHLPNQQSRRSLPDYTEQIIDLASAEMGATLAWVYYFFHREMDAVDPIIAQRLKHDIYRKIILPYRQRNDFWWLGFGDGLVNNWNPWCNAGVLQCLLLLENDSADLSRDVYKTMQSVDRFIHYVRSDGACEEGPSYWSHAAGKLYDCLQLLDWATAGRINLFDRELIRRMGEYISRSYVGRNWVVNFADASAAFSADRELIYRYGKATGSREMMRFASHLTAGKRREIIFGGDFLRTLESLYYDRELKATPPEHATPAATLYPETQFYYLKNDNGFFFAAKGGHNAESHNHNDVGSFSLWVRQTPVMIDAGVGTYTRQTFSPERYRIWTMRSVYHNLPQINGHEQPAGQEYRAGEVRCDVSKRTLRLDIAPAYPAEAGIERWHRTYRLENRRLVIHDDFQLRTIHRPNEVNFLLWGSVNAGEPGKVAIRVQEVAVELLYDAERFAAEVETIALPDARLSKIWGEQIYRLTLKDRHPARKGAYRFVVQNR